MSGSNNGRRFIPWVLLILCGGALFVSLAVNALLGVGLMLSGRDLRRTPGPVDEYPQFDEVWSYGEGDVKAVRIAVEGIIARDPVGGGFLSPRHDPTERIIRQIRAARNDGAVRALILEVNSPGGAITPSDEIYRALVEFKESAADRCVTVFIRDLAASGGYMVSLPGDILIAEPTAVIGSIGVIMQSLNWSELSERLGIRDTTITSVEHKDLLNPFREVTRQEREMVQGMVDAYHSHFMDQVLRHRSLATEQVEHISDGRIMIASEALEYGLVDSIGYWDDALEATREMLGVEHIRVIRYRGPPNVFVWLGRAANNLRFLWDDANRPAMQYRWRP